jgi:hypothetical protein
MIEYIAGWWSHAPKLGLAFVAIAVIWGVVRIVRSRRPAEPARTLMRPMSPDDPANLDSSHIGGPLLESTVDPGGRGSGPITKGGSG